MATNTRSEAISGKSLDVSETTDTLEDQLDINIANTIERDKNFVPDQEDECYQYNKLMVASLHGQFETVKCLVDEGADVNKTCECCGENKTALMWAATISSEMSENTSITSSNSIDDKVALLKRILENKTKIIECLLLAGADPNIRDEKGKNVMILVTANSLSKCLGSMFQGPVPVTIQTVANTELVKRCQYLIKHGVDINTTDSDRMTALMHAVRNRLDNICEFLLDHKADVDIVDNNKNTALTYSVLTGSKHLSRLLLQRGAKLLTHEDLRRFVPSQDLLEKSCEMCKLLLNGDDTNMDVSIASDTNSAITQDSRGLQISDPTVCLEVDSSTTLWNYSGEACCRKAVRNQTQMTTSDNTNNSRYPVTDDLNNDLGQAILLSAVTKKSFMVCKFALDHGANPNTKDNDDKTVLIHAIMARSVKICNLLLHHGAETHLTDTVGKTTLMYAVSQDLPEFADLLISSGADVNLQDVTDRTALMYAAMNNSTQSCKLLVESKADLNIQDKHGMTAVLYCAQKSLMDPLGVLLSGGANPDLCDNKRMSALMYTVVNDSPDCCKLLVDHGANINIQNPDGRSALMFCVTKNSEELLKIVVSGGANREIKDKEGHTALRPAVRNTRPECCKLLVDHGADVVTPVFFRRHHFNKDCLEILLILLTGKPDLEIKDKEGHTALWLAVRNTGPECCKLLVDHGADVNSQDETGETPVMCSFDRHHFNKDCLDILLTGKPDLNLKNKKHETALLKASRENLPDICETLVCHGADVNIQDMMGMSAMMHAVLGYSYKCVEYFLSLGVDPNEQMGHAYVPHDNDDGDVNLTLQELGRGKTAFQLAVILDFVDLCRLMMSYFADVNKQDRDGRTALMYAVLHDSSKCFSLLLECADLTVVDNEGRTVMSYATKSDYIYRFQQMGLEERGAGEGENVSVLSLLIKDVNFLTHLQKFRGDLDLYKAARQIDVVLENGASPILEPHERSLLHNIFILRTIALDNEVSYVIANIPMDSPDIQRCIQCKRNQLLRLLVCNGVVRRARRSQFSTYCTVMQTVLEQGTEDIFKYLIANCYLTDDDVAYMRNPGRFPRIGYICHTLDDNMQVPDETFQHPWPLVKLAFISVSTALGGGPGREARVSKTGLPAKLQDMLMFRQPAAQIPVRKWENLELFFDPVKYEELPRPRPLLYYWPLGRQV